MRYLFLSLASLLFLLNQAVAETSEQEMMERMMEASQPSVGHERLKPIIGTWTARSSWQMSPDEKPELSTATVQRSWIMGQRFVREEYQDHSKEKPFRGMGILGYDNTKKEYDSTWIDTMTTGTFRSSGNYDPSKEVIALSGSAVCPMTGKEQQMRSELEVVNNDKNIFRVYNTTPDGKEYKSLEIVYERVKG